MFKFEHPDYLIFLVGIPICIALYIIGRVAYKQAVKKFANTSLWNDLMPTQSKNKPLIKIILFTIGLTCLVIALANPQWGTKKETVDVQSSDIMVALDISNSMLAEDIAPSRMARAKRIAEDIIEGLKGERIGIIIFAGNAYLQMPLTLDYAAAKLFIKSASPRLATTQGTAFTEVFDLAERCFEENDKTQKALIVITDGEDHDENAIERAKISAEKGMVIFTVGVGTNEGGFIPMNYGQREDYVRDANGQPVRTKINEELLNTLAINTTGEYFSYAQQEEIPDLLADRIARLEKKQVEQRSFTEFESYFQYFLFAGILLLIIELILPYSKSDWLKNRNWLNV